LFDEDWVNKLKSTTDKRIIFTGFLYGQYVDELIQHCYLYVQPSDVEGLSPVILTAMGMGKCVVSSDIPENSYLVENNGFLFEKGNVESLASVLEKLLRAEEEVKQKGKSSQEFVKKNFSWDTAVDKYVELFHVTSDS
jgi:glycosyltransferase involved in cell wall biosynthesis